MAFTFEADPRALVAERSAQFAALGTPREIIDDVAGRLGADLWSDEPGSWPYEWSRAAARAERDGDPLLASRLYGLAKYPCLGNDVHRAAYEQQLRTYLEAAPAFEARFERRTLQVPYREATTPVPVHIFHHPAGRTVPTVLALGGIDTWKMDIHRTAATLGRNLGVNAVTVDGVGVGESKVASAPDGDLILAGVVDEIREVGSGTVGVMGWSFGGTWAIKLALTGVVDAAVSNGGPIEQSFSAEQLSRWPNGMPGILANSLHRSEPFSDVDALAEAMAGFRLSAQQPLDRWGASPAPLLVVNGARDPYVPTSDVTMFDARPNTVTRIVPDASHCAAEKASEVAPWMMRWLAEQLT